MLYKILTHRVPLVAAAAFVGLLVLAATLLTRGTPVQGSPAQPPIPASVNPNAPQTAFFTCLKVTQVGVEPNYLVDVVCSTAINGINIFAFPMADPGAPMVLSAFTTAYVMGQQIDIHYYDDTATGPPFHCYADNCRKIAIVYVHP